MVITIRSFAASPPPPGTVFLAGEDRAPTVAPASLRRHAADTLSQVRMALTTCDLPSSCRRHAVARSAFEPASLRRHADDTRSHVRRSNLPASVVTPTTRCHPSGWLSDRTSTRLNSLHY